MFISQDQNSNSSEQTINVQVGQSHFLVPKQSYSNYANIINLWTYIITVAFLSEIIYLATKNIIILFFSLTIFCLLTLCLQIYKNMKQVLKVITLILTIFMFICMLYQMKQLDQNVFKFINICLGFTSIFYAAFSLKNVYLSFGIIVGAVTCYLVASSLIDTDGYKNLMSTFLLVMLNAVSFSCAASIILGMAMFSCIQKDYFTRWNVIGMLYTFGILSCLSLFYFMHLSIVLLGWEAIARVIYLMIAEIQVVMFSFAFKKEIIIFFCDGNEGLQKLTFPSENTSDYWIQIPENILKNKRIVLISPHFCTELPQQSQNSQEAINIKNNQAKGISHKIGDCLICFQKQAQILWKPCSHATICLNCYIKLYKQGQNDACILCKQSISEVHLLKTQKQQDCLMIQKGYKRSQKYMN